MLNVGIHDNLVLSKAEKSAKEGKKPLLVLTFKTVHGGSPLDVLSGGGSLNTQEQPFTFFPPRVDDGDDAAAVGAKIAELRDPLSHILSQYVTGNQSKFNKMFDGTGVTAENYNTKIMSQETLNKIYDNVIDQFLETIRPFVGDGGKRMRMIFVRSSRRKHYPRLRSRYLDSQPFMEPMDVPVTKLAFSKYEVTNQLNHGTPVDATVTAPSEANVQDAEQMFNS